MSSQFSLINEEFASDLAAIRILVNEFNDPGKSPPKVRIAAANSATLLLAATFEQFIREMARAYAQAVVAAADSFKKIPQKLAQTAWKRTIASLAKMEIEDGSTTFSELAASEALRKFQAVYAFCRGDKTQDIYEELIHNENNMRPGQINSLFKLSDLKDACSQAATKQPLQTALNEPDPKKTHGLLLSGLEDFFERRNEIAHELNPSHSSGTDQLLKDVVLFEAFGNSLSETLEELVAKNSPPNPFVDQVFVKKADGSLFEVHSVPINVNAVTYAKAHRAKGRHVGFLYTIVLKDGKVFDFSPT